MEAYDTGMQVQVDVHSGGISNVVGEPKIVGEKHEDIGQVVVKFSVLYPKRATINIIGPADRGAAANVLEKLVEYMTGQDDPPERRIRRPLEDVVEPARLLLSGAVERIVGGGQARRDLEGDGQLVSCP